VNPIGLAAGVAGDAIRSAPPLQARGSVVRNLELVEPNPNAVIRDLDAAASANVPVAIAGHPAFRRLREDAHALYAIGYDPRNFRRDGASGLIPPAPRNKTGFQGADIAYETVMSKEDTIMEYLQRGLDIGAERWYDGDEILNIFIEAMGDPLSGRAAFDMFNEISAISSATSTVPAEMGRAIFLWTQLLAGKTPGQVTSEMIPKGLGGKSYNTSIRPGLKRFDTGVDPFGKVLKTPAYASNKSGDFDVFTGDRWMTGIAQQAYSIRSRKLTSGDPFPYSAAGSGYYNAYVELANRVGLKPAEFQAAVWVGSGAVQNPEAYTQVFFNRMGALAKERNISITEATQRWMRGELGLQAILGGNIVSDLSRRAAFEVRQDRMNQEGEGERSE